MPFWGVCRLSWSRTFRPRTKAEAKVEWNPDQFASDGLLPSWLGLQGIEELSVQKVKDQSDNPPAQFEFFVQGKQEQFEVLADAALVAKIKLYVPPGKRGRLGLDIDYPARVRNLLNNPHLLPKLAWGPEAWGQASRLPETNHKAWRNAEQDQGRLHLRLGRSAREVAGQDFDGIEARLRGLPSTRLEIIEEGHGILDWNFTGGSAVFVLSGEIDVWQIDRYAGPRIRGEFLHEVIAGMPRNEVCARVRSEVLVFELEELWAALAQSAPWTRADTRFAQLLGYSAVRSALRTSGQLEAATYQAFPGARAVVLPGPYKADKVVQFNMPVQKHDALEALLPPRIQWHPRMPFALFFVARFAGFGPEQPELAKVIQGGAAYCECGLMIPTIVVDEEGERLKAGTRLFVPWIFPTSLMAMFAGREIYGYPKTWSTIEIQEDTMAKGRLMVRRGGVTLADVSYQPLKGLSTLSNVATRLTAPLMTSMTPSFLKTLKVICHKRLWSGIARNGKLGAWNPTYLSVDELADSGFEVGKVKRLAPIQLTKAEIQLSITQGPNQDPALVTLDTYGGLGSRVEYAMTMNPGTAQVDYLGPTTRLDDEDRAWLTPEQTGVPEPDLGFLRDWHGNWENR